MIDRFDLPNLTTFTTGQSSFYEVESIELKSIETEDDFLEGAFYYVKSVTITSTLIDD